MKGIVLAGGTGTRLHPATLAISKQLIPVYDKPMIYYPISVLMLAGIREILIISTRQDISSYKKLLGNGSKFGCVFSYETQPEPKGLVQAFTIGEQFIGNENVCLILGDNLFHGAGLTGLVGDAASLSSGGKIFGQRVSDPERYGVAEIDAGNKVLSIEEKPEKPKSDIAVTGLYFFDNRVVDIAKNVEPSARGEYEITSVIQAYLDLGELSLQLLPRGFAWLDTGTHETMIQASNYVYAVESRSDLKIACLEEIALNNGWLSQGELKLTISSMGKSSYASYLLRVLNESS